MQLSVKNFQSWASATINIDGLTVLVGPSNLGKSSLFRALKGVLRNEIPDGFIRNNQDDPLEIELEVDGHHIKASRKRGSSTKYILDGKTYTSLGGKVPEEIENLKYGEMKIGDYKVDPIFAKQNKAQFLIDDDQWKPQELNAILGAFSRTEKLDSGKKEANLRITQRKSEASTLASEIRSAEERSGSLLEITGGLTVIADAIGALERGVLGDETVVGQLGAVLYHQSRLQPLQEILDTLTIPDFTEAINLLQIVERLEIAISSLLMSKFLRSFESELDLITTKWSDLTMIYKQRNGVAALLVLLDRAAVYCTEYIDQLSLTIEQAETQLTEAKVLNDSIAYLASAISSLPAYESFTLQLSELNSSLEIAEEELETIRREYAEVEAKKKAKQTKVCPTCGSNGICAKCGNVIPQPLLLEK